MNNVIKRGKILSHLRQLNADIIFLQETHILNTDVIKLRRSWGGQVFHSSFNAKGRGTAILIRNNISFTSEKVISDSMLLLLYAMLLLQAACSTNKLFLLTFMPQILMTVPFSVKSSHLFLQSMIMR